MLFGNRPFRGHCDGGAGSLREGTDTSTPAPTCFTKHGLWREVKASDGGQRSSWGCMCSNSCLPEVQEGKLDICVVCKRDITHSLPACVTPETQMNPNAGFHHFFSYLVSIWGYEQDHICTFISDQRLQMNWNAGRCPCKCVIMIFYLSGSHFLVFTWLYCSDKKHSDLLLQKARICPVSVFEQWTDTYCNCIVSRLWVILRAPIKCQQSEMLKYACEINAVFIDFFLFLK